MKSKAANFHFIREHYIGDVRHQPSTDAYVAPALHESLHKRGVGQAIKARTDTRPAASTAKKD